MKLKALKAKVQARKEADLRVQESIGKIIEDRINIVKTFGKPKYELKPAFKPSALGSPCLRKIYYDYFRVEQDFEFPLEAKKILIVGDSIHELLSSLLRQSGVLVDYRNKTDGNIPKSRHTGLPDPEFPLKCPDLEISAKVDAVVIRDNKLCIVEFKSSNDSKFAKLKAPEEAHGIQAGLYYHLFNKLLKGGQFSHIPELNSFNQVDEVRVLYLNKNNSQIKEFLLDNPQAEFEKALTKMEAVRALIAQDQLPEKTWDWCKGCPWRAKCAKDYKVPKN